jgi:SAM-dependent methyltransferase
MSVIEHGVNQQLFLTEVYRVLQPGGYLLLSTDFWHEPMEPRTRLFGASDLVFSRADIELLLQVARQVGFDVPEAVWPLHPGSPVIEFGDLAYTFLYLAMRKGDRSETIPVGLPQLRWPVH